VQLQLLGQLDSDPARFEQVDDLATILQLRQAP